MSIPLNIVLIRMLRISGGCKTLAVPFFVASGFLIASKTEQLLHETSLSLPTSEHWLLSMVSFFICMYTVEAV